VDTWGVNVLRTKSTCNESVRSLHAITLKISVVLIS
jgi:hypothetical protein